MTVSQRLSLNGDSNYAAWSDDGKRLYLELDSGQQMLVYSFKDAANRPF